MEQSLPQRESYLQFIHRNQNLWGRLRHMLTKMHLKMLKFYDMVEEEATYKDSLWQFLIKFLIVILKSSSMHGTFHITQFKRHPCEVFLWIFLLSVAGLSSLICINVFWLRYYFNPLVISLERDYMNWNITFPSLTICETQKINKTALYDFVNESNISNKTELIAFIKQLANTTYENMQLLPDFNGISPDEFVDVLDKVTNKMDGQMVLTGTKESIPLQRTITEMGVCFSFNSRIASYITPSYFLRNNRLGAPAEYTVNFHDMTKVAFVRDLMHCCVIYTHNPLDVPNALKKLVPSHDRGVFTLLKFSAIPIISSSSVRSLLFSQRKCRFMDETNLKHFPVYSTSLCQMECKIEAILKLCGCVPFFYKKNSQEKYCDVKGLKCVRYYSEIIKQIVSTCDCYTNCEDIKFTLEEVNTAFWIVPSAIRWELSNTKTRLKRNVIFGYVDAFVATGNVFNLFLGISVLSFVEAFYLYCIYLPLKCKRTTKTSLERSIEKKNSQLI